MTAFHFLFALCIASGIVWLAATFTWRRLLARNAAAVLIGAITLLTALLWPAITLACIAGSVAAAGCIALGPPSFRHRSRHR